MPDIELIIKMPEELYKKQLGDSWTGNIVIHDAIANGIPLPKGHGKLIAEPTDGDVAKTIGGQNDFAGCIREAVKAVFDNAPTIVPADNAESEEL